MTTTTAANANEASGVLGEGRHTYRLVPDWPTLPAGKRFGYTHGVAVDSQGRVIIFNQGPDAVMLFDEAGAFIKSWNRGFEKGAHGLTLNREGGQDFLYLTDYERADVVKATPDGEVALVIGRPPHPAYAADPGKYKPTNVAVADNGDVYVADGYGQHYVHHFDRTGNYVRSWGGQGAGPGQFNCPHGLIIDRRRDEPTVLVADRANVRLQRFTLEGKPVASFGQRDLRHPCHFDIDPATGDLLVADLFGRVTVFDRDDRLVMHLGDDPGVQGRPGYPNLPHAQRMPGKFISPHSACWDRGGTMYVVEWIEDGRVTKLRRA